MPSLLTACVSGQVTLRVAGCPAGTHIELQHAEILGPGGLVDNSFCERPKYWLCAVRQQANFTCGGGPAVEEYRVKFVYMGFRVPPAAHPALARAGRSRPKISTSR